MQALLAISSDAVLMTNGRGQIFDCNDGAEVMFGYSAHEFAGMDRGRLLVPDDENVRGEFDPDGQDIVELAESIAKGRIAAVLEGGYHLRGLGECVRQMLKSWAGVA